MSSLIDREIPLHGRFGLPCRPLAIVCLLAGLLSCPAAYANSYTLSGEEWARPRSGPSVAKLAPVRQLVNEWMSTQQGVIEIRYPGGESGILWASELSDWLVALGIPSDLIAIQSGSPNGDELIMQIRLQQQP